MAPVKLKDLKEQLKDLLDKVSYNQVSFHMVFSFCLFVRNMVHFTYVLTAKNWTLLTLRISILSEGLIICFTISKEKFTSLRLTSYLVITYEGERKVKFQRGIELGMVIKSFW